ncbi:hypothetical protein VOLCADRAFT_96214 [Volvox carteri f. nagariensis]|uniref:Uncharacterized protein n=1 Tax=Volvox carteri f. nagariensis TaxID=3068 RepID=D8U9I7_VOLCA|nr:uncharacterized protein VOLCADRAFT_96214 [Volvox carteri f. nagariensis]EFJ43648.1 hypothetical protein VOLCADRAFT_96214 [Volvox carteri f. nagariensis]|eukprot:XP_002955348.1 hypothetical protein VOLCADRAFT_96214 [Volvox carteri f. nagariensis]
MVFRVVEAYVANRGAYAGGKGRARVKAEAAGGPLAMCAVLNLFALQSASTSPVWGDTGQAATGSSRTYMELGAASWLGIQTMIRDTVAKVDISVCEFVQIVRGLNKMEDGGTTILQQSGNMGARSTSRSTSSVSVKELEKL